MGSAAPPPPRSLSLQRGEPVLLNVIQKQKFSAWVYVLGKQHGPASPGMGQALNVVKGLGALQEERLKTFEGF